MGCIFLNNTLISLSKASSESSRVWSECYRGVDEYSSDEELAQVHLFLDYPDALLKFAAACTCIFMILGIPGNIATIVALSNYRKVRNATAIFIINLSVCDLLIACTMLPLAISLFLKQSWTAGRVLCRIFPALNYNLNAVSLFSIMAITINRYVLVSHPFHYTILYQTRNLIIMIVAIWVGAFLIIVPMLTEIWGRFSLDPKVGFCTVIPDKHNNSPRVLLVVIGYIIPCVLIVGCYSRIMYIARKSTAIRTCNALTSNIQSDSTSRNQEIIKQEEEGNRNDIKTSSGMLAFKNIFKCPSRETQGVTTGPTKRDKRLQSMIIAIMITYFVSHIPFMIAEVAVNESSSESEPYEYILGYMLFLMTVCSNPIIYVIMSKEYRQAYNSVFGFMWKR